MGRVVLVTGSARFIGSRLVAVLARDPAISRVIAVDSIPPDTELAGAEFVRADIRNPIIGSIMSDAGVDTVVHAGVISTPRQAGGRSTMKEINVLGSMQLLAAVQRAPSVRTLIVKSTSAVYGAGPKDPAAFTEDMAPKHPPRTGWAKDAAEVEGYVRSFSRRRPDVAVTTLRLANVIGPQIQTAVTEYFDLRVIPTILGHDARMQFLHEDDCLEIMHRMTVAPEPGTFNAAGAGVLMLSQAVRRTGRPQLPLPGPLMGSVGRSMARAGLIDFSPEQVQYLTYGRVLDTTKLDALGIKPSYSTIDAFDAFVEGHQGHAPHTRQVSVSL